jgi:tRNA pseudouridine38-40 synthase
VPVVKLVLAYDGTDFAGWARQPRRRTVEGEVRSALALVLGKLPKLSVAGRTDAGVHARGQVVTLATEADPARLQDVVNGLVAPEVVVLSASRAPDGFDARYSAKSREYLYRINTAPLADPFEARFVWHRPGVLQLTAMRAAARTLIGRHDFASFGRPTGAGSGTVRDLRSLTVRKQGDHIEIRARANAFIQQMVRSLVGTLVDCGAGRIDPSEVPDIIKARNRSRAGRLAPAHGLTLERVIYRG